MCFFVNIYFDFAQGNVNLVDLLESLVLDQSDGRQRLVPAPLESLEFRLDLDSLRVVLVFQGVERQLRFVLDVRARESSTSAARHQSARRLRTDERTDV
jgi:hypothetical protein